MERAGLVDKEKPVKATDKVRADFAMMGHEMAEPEDADTEDEFVVFESNGDVFELFMALGTQWNLALVGGGMAPQQAIWLGIRYESAIPLMSMFGFAIDDREAFSKLQLMENAAISAMGGD